MPEHTTPIVSATLVNQVADWLMQQALAEGNLERIVMGCCERLRAAGLPLTRGYFAFRTLHPLHRAIGITWSNGRGTTIEGYPHVHEGISEQFRAGPHFYMMERDLDYLRCRLDGGERACDFPILQDLRGEGMTDYLAFVVDFATDEGAGMLGSWATDIEGGFTDDTIEALSRIRDRLAVACKMAMKGKLMRTVAQTYLGADAGARVLSGQIQRGDGQSIRSAIWYTDMRGSTVLADHLPQQDYIDALNAYFDATGGAVRDAGGEILTFAGDAMLAIFPLDEAREPIGATCGRALRASLDAVARMTETNAARRAAGKDPIGFGIAMHLGDVTYGNVGTSSRLTFSVFGQAVNEVARLEALTKELDRAVVASETFARHVDADWRPHGRHCLRGVDAKIEVLVPEQLCPALEPEAETA